MLKPSIGRAVHVFTDPFHNNGAEVAAATITRVWEERTDGKPQLINVRVTHDGPTQGGEHRQDWLTSIPLYESREAAEAAHAASWENVDHPNKPATPFAAFWPPRV